MTEDSTGEALIQVVMGIACLFLTLGVAGTFTGNEISATLIAIGFGLIAVLVVGVLTLSGFELLTRRWRDAE